MKKLKIILPIVLLLIILLILVSIKEKQLVEKPNIIQQDNIKLIEEPKKLIFDISNSDPDFKNYTETVDQLKEWDKESGELTETGTYGQSTSGKDLYYFRIKKSESNPKVFIHACIHGNEPLASSIVMHWIGQILSKYNVNEKVTDLIDSRELIFIPVVSVDSYPKSRYVDRVDPNRNFPSKRRPDLISVKPIEELKKFFVKEKPQAVISGHTWGRVFLIPWGESNSPCENFTDYKKIIGDITTSPYNFKTFCQIEDIPQQTRVSFGGNMSELSGYGVLQTSKVYNHPIYGSEVDWYYRNGAFSIVIEFGDHQRIPTHEEIKIESDKTFDAMLLFLEKAPLVKIKL